MLWIIKVLVKLFVSLKATRRSQEISNLMHFCYFSYLVHVHHRRQQIGMYWDIIVHKWYVFQFLHFIYYWFCFAGSVLLSLEEWDDKNLTLKGMGIKCKKQQCKSFIYWNALSSVQSLRFPFGSRRKYIFIT